MSDEIIKAPLFNKGIRLWRNPKLGLAVIIKPVQRKRTGREHRSFRESGLNSQKRALLKFPHERIQAGTATGPIRARNCRIRPWWQWSPHIKAFWWRFFLVFAPALFLFALLLNHKLLEIFLIIITLHKSFVKGSNFAFRVQRLVKENAAHVIHICVLVGWIT